MKGSSGGEKGVGEGVGGEMSRREEGGEKRGREGDGLDHWIRFNIITLHNTPLHSHTKS